MINGICELDPDRMVVLSLKPRFAEAILAGDKTVELRRVAPRITVPTRALLYATAPERALMGTCVVTGVESAGLASLWDEHGLGTELLHREFEQYFNGMEVGTALTLAQPHRFSRKIPLHDLKAKPPGFHPPQSFSYVNAATGEQLLRAAA